MDPWSRGREVARGVLRSSPKSEKALFFAIGKGSRIVVLCFLHISAQMCLCQMSGRRPPRITGRVVTIAARGWAGAPNERAPFRFHDAVVGFVDRCLSESRRLESNIWLIFSQADFGPTSAQEVFFSFLFFNLEHFFVETCAHSERYRNFMAGIFEIQTIFWQHRVSSSIGLGSALSGESPIGRCRKYARVHVSMFRLSTQYMY